MSLFVAHHNFVRIQGALRVTPAMEAGIASSVWTVEERVARVVDAAAEPVAKAERQPLRMPIESEKPATPARALPNGGWLRLVGGTARTPAPSDLPRSHTPRPWPQQRAPRLACPSTRPAKANSSRGVRSPASPFS